MKFTAILSQRRGGDTGCRTQRGGKERRRREEGGGVWEFRQVWVGQRQGWSGVGDGGEETQRTWRNE